MACCDAGQQTCGALDTPAQCCTTTAHSDAQFTASARTEAPIPVLVNLPALGAAAALTHIAPPGRTDLLDAISPPGHKHPPYLVISILRV